MLRIAICDDDKYYLKLEEQIIQRYMRQNDQECEIILFASGNELLESLDYVVHYDAVILDIDMKGLNGIETARRIRELSSKVYVVFVTAFISYAPEGYKVEAHRYILKDSIGLEYSLKECMDAMLLQMNNLQKQQRLKYRGAYWTVLPSNIIYIESKGHSARWKVILEKEEVMITKYEKLDVIEEELRNCGFCRIHKSYLVNLRYVSKMEQLEIVLKDGTRLSISKAKYVEVKDTMIRYFGGI